MPSQGKNKKKRKKEGMLDIIHLILKMIQKMIMEEYLVENI